MSCQDRRREFRFTAIPILRKDSLHITDEDRELARAIGAVQSLPSGVCSAMNSRIWDPAKVRKNVAADRFEAV